MTSVWVHQLRVVLVAAVTSLIPLASFPAAAPAPVPIPHPRPADLPAAPSQETQPDPEAPAGKGTAPNGAETNDRACLDRLAPAGFEFEAGTMPSPAKPACLVEAPVRLKAVSVASRTQTVIRLPDEPILSCRFVERLGHWLADLVGPLIVGRLGSDARAMRTGAGYECRNRNRAENGKLSAHANGLAVDITSFELANGQTLTVKPAGDERARATVAALRTAACGWFTTVLGPGTDAAHAEHMHVDILPHGSSDHYRICQ